MMLDADYKSRLLAHCEQLLLERIRHAQAAMLDAQESANSEEKSSAGDKYETGRAMSHLNRDMNAKQMAEAKKELDALRALSTTAATTIGNGSCILSDQGIFFIAAGLGVITFETERIVVLSPKAPLALAFKGKGNGQTFSFNGKVYAIQANV